jgi:HD-like signal output (HDOD) protein/ActR/RegA family two-component response regulator
MKKRLLFVDDDPNMLMGLKRALHSMQEQWDMEFVDSGEAALNLLDKPFDVVVSDMRMPGISGLDLLNTVQEKFPQTVRILLSGQTDRQSVLDAVARTHQFLSKPFDARQLKALLAQTIALGDLLDNVSLKTFVSRMSTIPSLPNLYLEVMNALRENDPIPARIGEIIGRDIGMTAKILQVANSVTYAMRGEITQPEHAVMILGTDAVQSLVLSLSIFSALSPGSQAAYSADSLWRHSNLTGAFCRAIARAEGVTSANSGGYLCAGLLHDVGKLIVATTERDLPRKINQIATADAKPSWQAEQDLLGCTHAEIGAYLLGIWGLPFPIVEAVAWHHRPSQSMADQVSPLAAVHVANALHVRWTSETPDAEEPIDEAFLERIGCLDRLDAWAEACDNIFRQGTSNQ